jgi:hypothetical protein
MKSSAAVCVCVLFAFVAYGQDQYERILSPIGAYNLTGAYGSLWQTELTGFNTGEAFVPVKVSLSEVCALPEGCPDIPAQPHQVFSLVVGASQGGFLFVGREHADDVRFNLRIFDSTRQSESYGTILPVARERDFSMQWLSLLNVIVSPNSRTLLRVYGFDNTPDVVTVKATRTSFFPGLVGKSASFQVPILQHLPSVGGAEFPSFGSIDIGAAIPPELLTPGVGPPRFLVEVQPNEQKLWALITVTNNASQHVTAITPQ